MNANLTEETCTGTGNTLALAGVTTNKHGDNNLPFSLSFADGELVKYAVRDSAGVIKVNGVGTYVAATDDIIRNDLWNYNGTVVDKSPATNITLSGGTHTVTCTEVAGMFNANYTEPDISDTDLYVIGSNITGTGNIGLTANRCTYTAHKLESPMTVTTLGINVSSADATATIAKVGIYSVGLAGKPDKLLVSANIDVTTTGVKSVTLATPLDLVAGYYYDVVASDGTPTLLSTALNSIGSAPHGYKLNTPRYYLPYETLSGWTDLPAVASGSLTYLQNYGPVVGYR